MPASSSDIDLSGARLKPFNHQVIGVEMLVKHPYFFITDEMGAGKTKQVIDAAVVLFLMGLIDRVVVVAPASVRAVWFDNELGELKKHLWDSVAARIRQYHGNEYYWVWNYKKMKEGPVLDWVITNYEFIRQDRRLAPLMQECDNRTLLVLDESSAIKSWKAQQTRACKKLRKKCGRVVLLNGTPIANSPGDLYSQGDMLHPKILGCQNWFHFRARYAILGGFKGKQIVSWRMLEDMTQKFAPYVLRRLKKDCLDLPPKLPSVSLTTTLTPATWKIYKEMRADMIAWLSENEAGTASQAAVKSLRLSQITSGFVGGVVEVMNEDGTLPLNTQVTMQEVGDEKLQVFIEFLSQQLASDPSAKILVWCRFRPELARIWKYLEDAPLEHGRIWGGQKQEERQHALRLLDPTTMPKGPVVIVGTPASGSLGLNLTGAHTVVYMSNDYNLKTRLQSEDRVHRPGQTYPVSYYDVVATGPKGQKTIDHLVLKALRAKESVASWTTDAWIDALNDE